ncbi:hypothetical protein ABT075_46965 [Streptomyces sp. NPDC002677]|uniref:hypothetical protein n=1 Tax=Streptomyces sp. NPDC002677 TaxID=3154774 RepID=UPI0033166454
MAALIKRGNATNFGESEPAVSAVAGADPYALAVSAPSSRSASARVNELVDEIRRTARLLSDTSAMAASACLFDVLVS